MEMLSITRVGLFREDFMDLNLTNRYCPEKYVIMDINKINATCSELKQKRDLFNLIYSAHGLGGMKTLQRFENLTIYYHLLPRQEINIGVFDLLNGNFCCEQTLVKLNCRIHNLFFFCKSLTDKKYLLGVDRKGRPW